MQLFIGVTLLCLFLPTEILTQVDFSLVIVSTSNPDINVLRLECRDRNTETDVSDAFFWLNGTSLFDIVPPGTISRLSDGAEIMFLITRDLEGIYTCGTQTNPSNRRESDSHYFVGMFLNLSYIC